MGGVPKSGGAEAPLVEVKTFGEGMMDSWINASAAEEACSGPEVQEKGHQAKGNEGAHMLYNKDGYYTRAAACYILKAFKAAGGQV
jgi:hypothetical protein